MVRNIFYFLLVGVGVLPLSAKDSTALLAASKAVSKGVQSANAAHVSVGAEIQPPTQKKPVTAVGPALTSDMSRAAASALLASKPEPPADPEKMFRNDQRPYCEADSFVSRSLSSSLNYGPGIAAKPVRPRAMGRLARVTAYWAAEGDYYTERCISATGVRLHDGHCAVDPSIIPYGSVVDIVGVGKFLAVDTGSAVISRTAAREGGHTSAERSALVVDLFFENRREGERFAAATAKFTSISWWTPTAMGVEAKAARSLFAEEDWTMIQGKQL